MAGAKIALSSTSGELKTDGSDNARVNLPVDSSTAGFAVAAGEVDAGLVTGSRYIKELEVTEDYRLRVGVDSMLFHLTFEGTNIARHKIQQNDTTMTCAQTTGAFTLNSGSSVTSGQATNIKTYRNFPIFMSAQTWVEWEMAVTNSAATNVISEEGLGYCSGATTQMTDGIVFRRISGGQLRAVIINNSTDIFAQDITVTNITARDGVGAFDPTETNHYMISTHNDEVQWWINDTLVCKTYVPSASGGPTQSHQQPFMARVNNTGTASSARQVVIRAIGVTQGELATWKPWGQQVAGWGGHSCHVQPGSASGSTVTRGAGTLGWPTSATARANGTWTATTAPAVNSLGGQWVSPAISTLTSEADYPIFAYLNPAGTATLPGKTLYITGVRWGKTVATAAASTNSINVNFIIGVGGTAANTSTADAAAAWGPRGLVVDTIPFKSTTAVGDYVEGGNMDFSQSPIVVPPGCYLMWIARPFGTVASNTLTLVGTVAFTGFFE